MFEQAHAKNTRPLLIRKAMLTATFAALYAIFRLIPLDRAIGIPGVITAGGVIIPVIALLLDAPFAATAVFLGTFISSFAPWNPLRFLGLDFLPGTLNVLVVSLTIRGRRVYASVLFLAVILIFTLTPYTEAFVGVRLFSPPIPYYWLHLVALVILISPFSKNILQRLESKNYRSASLALAEVALIGTMLEHLTGGILSAVVFRAGIVPFWPIIYLWYPGERIVITALATLIGVPIALNTSQIRDTLLRPRSRHVGWQASAFDHGSR